VAILVHSKKLFRLLRLLASLDNKDANSCRNLTIELEVQPMVKILIIMNTALKIICGILKGDSKKQSITMKQNIIAILQAIIVMRIKKAGLQKAEK